MSSRFPLTPSAKRSIFPFVSSISATFPFTKGQICYLVVLDSVNKIRKPPEVSDVRYATANNGDMAETASEISGEISDEI